MNSREQELKTIEGMRALRDRLSVALREGLSVEDNFEALLELVRLSMVSDDEPFITQLRAGIAEQHLREVLRELREAEQRAGNGR